MGRHAARRRCRAASAWKVAKPKLPREGPEVENLNKLGVDTTWIESDAVVSATGLGTDPELLTALRNMHSAVGSNGSSSTSVEATTRCKAMQMVEVNLRRKETQCVSFVRECRWNQ